MSLKNGIYQLRFVPAGGRPAPGELTATGEALRRPIRILPNTPPYFRNQHWRVTNVHDNSYFIEWTVGEGPPFFFSFDGPGGPVRQDTPVLLLPNKQEWVITRGEGEHVYRIGLANQLVGVNLAIDKVRNDEAMLRRFVVGGPTPQWVFVPVEVEN